VRARTKARVALVATALALAAGPPAAAEAPATGAQPFIVGGTSPDPALASGVVRIVTVAGALCSGTVIAPSWVLTAGHCIEDRATVSGGGTTLTGLTWSIGATGLRHPFYTSSPSLLRYDFGLYQLDTPAPVVSPAPLADYADTQSWAAGSPSRTLGWGVPGSGLPPSDVLLQASMTVVDDRQCDENDTIIGAIFDPGTSLCTYAPNVSGCNGDSGGPLFTQQAGRWVQVGLTSYGPAGCWLHTVAAWMPAGLPWIRSVVAGGPPMVRLWGADRYGTAADVATAFDPGGVVFVATGENFPDSVAAGVTASRLGGPVLLVARDRVPDITAAALRYLRPSRVVVAGGPQAVADAVVRQVAAITGVTVERRGGTDRYDTARLLGEMVWPGATGGRVWVAGGAAFADPLAASAAAATFGEPFVLVGDAGLPDSAKSLLARLAPTSIVAVGDGVTLGAATRDALRVLAPLTEIADPDVHVRAIRVWDGLPTASDVVMATSGDFADALAGVALAGAPPAGPLLLTPKACLPAPVRDRLRAFGPQLVWLLGGPAALDAGIESYGTCP